MAVLGRIYHRTQPLQGVSWGPSVYDDLFTMPTPDLPSGTGSGKDYVFIVTCNVGPFDNTGGPNADVTTRIGMRLQGELPYTWSHVHHQASGLFSPFGVTGATLGQPIMAVAYVRDYPANAALRVSLQQTGPTQFGAISWVTDLLVLCLDCTALGGARTASGWSGDRLRVEPMATGAVDGNVTQALPGAVDDAWLVAASRLFRTTGNVRLTVHNARLAHSVRGGRPEPLSIGTWTTQFVQSPAVNTVVSWVGTQGGAGDGGWFAALKLTGLDNGASSAFEPVVIHGAGAAQNNALVTRDFGFNTTRPADSMVQLVRASGIFADAGRTQHRAINVQANMNGWAGSSPLPSQRVGVFGQLLDLVALHGAATAPAGFEVPDSGSSFTVDRFATPGFAGTTPTGPVYEVVACQFSLSDWGPIPADPPVTFTELELLPDYEADLDALPDIAAPMRAVDPYAAQGESRRMLTAGQYEIRHGGGTRERLVVQVYGESLTIDHVEALRVQADTAAAFKFALDDGVMRAWRFVPGSLNWSEAGNGLVQVSASLVQHIYLAP